MRKVDARGDACPLPVVKAKKAIAELNGAGEVEVLVDNEIAVQNLTKMARQKAAGLPPKSWPSGNTASCSPWVSLQQKKRKLRPVPLTPAPIRWWSSRPTRWARVLRSWARPC